MVNTEPISALSASHIPQIVPMLTASVRRRMEAIESARAERPDMVVPEDPLMILGVLSLMATRGYCQMPEHIENLLPSVVIAFDALSREDDRDPAEVT